MFTDRPLAALAVFAVVSVVGWLLVRPGTGWWHRLARGLRDTDRMFVEDSLKHLYDCEAQRQACTLQSLAGVLAVSGDRTAEVVDRLRQLGMIEFREGGYVLTADGRSEALRVVRIHRLLERYLAEETGLDAAEWHAEADRREHSVSAEEAESLARRMGQPRFDPHGDPIPLASGEVAAPRGRPLTELPIGELAEIVHIEDEPKSVFSQLMAEGLYPGMRVRVFEVGPVSLSFEADAEEHILAPVIAANVSVQSLAEDEEMIGPFERLSSLVPGESALVAGISGSCRGLERRRLLDLGVIPGTRVEAEMRSPSGDPTAYRIRGALIALRREQADFIQVEKAPI